jgi:hypothetical protein
MDSNYQIIDILATNSPAVYQLASVPGVHEFLQVLADGRAFGVKMKLSGWRGRDKWARFVMS